MVPGMLPWGFLTPPVAGADLGAALVSSCLGGVWLPVDVLAVCWVCVGAILKNQAVLMKTSGPIYFYSKKQVVNTHFSLVANFRQHLPLYVCLGIFKALEGSLDIYLYFRVLTNE